MGRFEYLIDLIKSIELQTLKAKEVLLLLDNNSHCNQGARLLSQFDFLNIIFCNDMNLSDKRNYGANISKSQFIVYSDDDDIWDPYRSEMVTKALESYSVVCHNYGKFGSINGHKMNLLGVKNQELTIKNLLHGSNIFGGGSSIAIRREVVLSFPFNNSFLFCEDFEWWVRILSSKIKVFYIGRELVRYRVHNLNMTNNINSISKFSGMIGLSLFKQSVILLISSFMIMGRGILKQVASVFRLKW